MALSFRVMFLKISRFKAGMRDEFDNGVMADLRYNGMFLKAKTSAVQVGANRTGRNQHFRFYSEIQAELQKHPKGAVWMEKYVETQYDRPKPNGRSHKGKIVSNCQKLYCDKIWLFKNQ